MSSFWNYFSEIPSTPKAPSKVWDYLATPEITEGRPSQALQSAPSALFFNEGLVFWAMRNLPAKEAVKHFLIQGAIGTGKTTAIQLFLQSIAPRFRREREKPEQLIIFDAKGDIIPLLAGMGFSPEDENVWIINPYDARSSVWNIAEAVRSPLMARHLAALLVPEEKNSTAPFFWTASRELVYATILALNSIAGGKWELRDLLCALDSREHITAITAQHPRAKRIAAGILNDSQHSAGVISSLATKLGHFDQIAALWHKSENAKRFSITEFLQKPGVLILGNDPVLRESLWPINAVLLKALSKEILRRPNVDGPRFWFVLDEFTAMEKVDSVHELVNRGRSKGVSVLIGLQGIDKLQELYQETGANDLLEQCASKTFLRAGGPRTAEWIERFFGKYRRTEAVYSESVSPKGEHSFSVQYQIAERSMFTASFFMNLPFTGLGKMYAAVSDIPSKGVTLITRRWFDDILPWLIRPLNIPTIIPRDNIMDQTLEPWDEIEERSFCGGSSQLVETSLEEEQKTPKLPARKRRK
jgi:hypothetical protein